MIAMAAPAPRLGALRWGNVAEWAAGIGALSASLVALLLASWSSAESERRAAQDRASSAYERYLLLAVERPVLASGDLARIRQAGMEDAYGWFFGVLGNAGDEVVNAFPEDAGWRRALLAQLAFHCAHLRAMTEEERGHYSPAFQRMMQDVAQRRCAGS
jgi:hypothetical protein